jgi:hypothetical protein
MSLSRTRRAMPANAELQLELKQSIELKQRTRALEFKQQLVELTSNSIESPVANLARTTSRGAFNVQWRSATLLGAAHPATRRT